MATRRLDEIPRPEAKRRAILETDRLEETFVYLRGSGTLDLICGVCGQTLVEGVIRAQPDRLVFPEMILHGRFAFYCNRCSSYNEVRPYLG